MGAKRPAAGTRSSAASRGEGAGKATLAGLAVLLLTLAGCGAAARSHPEQARVGNTARSAGAFGWFEPPAAGSGWRVARIPDGATLFYPASWRAVAGDAGSASAAERTTDGRYLGYLNITPAQSNERADSWGMFRVQHNRSEGDTDVRMLAFVRGLRFRDGRGACVQDSYTTLTGARYREIACLVSGASAANVVVGAAPPQLWAEQARTLERAISATSS